MSEAVHCIVEYNEKGHLIFVEDYPGAYVRGKTQNEALKKIPDEIQSYNQWAFGKIINHDLSIEILERKKSDLHISDADSDILFDSEMLSMSEREYFDLKSLVLKSANDFKTLYDSFPGKDMTNKNPRNSFYGDVPLTANEMLMHTNEVTSYYIGEIGIQFKNSPDIYENRINGLKCIESVPNVLENQVFKGSYDEFWSLKKVMRRFIWHDRIHAKSMYRMGVSLWGKSTIANPFCF